MSAPSAAPALQDSATLAGPAAGRRRAQLVASGAEASTGRHLSLADVRALGDHPTPKARAALAAKFGRDYDRLAVGETRALADQVLELLSADSDPQVRRALAEALAASPSLPVAIAARLARDEIAVARPVLEQSSVLSDAELAGIGGASAAHALAIAGRAEVSADLVDRLLEQGDRTVVARLVTNPRARLSARTLRRIAEDHRDDPAVESGLMRRPALPYEVIDQLVAALSERLGWHVVRDRQISADEAHQLATAMRLRVRQDAGAPEGHAAQGRCRAGRGTRTAPGP